jgi:hypothetical protein
MNRPVSPSHLEPGSAPDLDERILLAEHAVIEREQRLREHALLFGDRLKAKALSTSRIAAFIGVGGFLLGWMTSSRGSRSRGERSRRAQQLAEAPWGGIVPLVWPLLPRGIRERVSPGVASFLAGIGLPLLAQRIAKKRAAGPPR